MSLTARETGAGQDFKQAAPGTHAARCYQIIDIGTQSGEYQGEPYARRQIIVRWELPNEVETFDGTEKPLIVSKFYTNSLGEKANLRRDLEAWRSRAFTAEELKGFDLTKILGQACMLSVVHTDKGKARVIGVAAVPKGMSVPPLFNPKSYFSMEEDWDEKAFEALPEGFKKLIMASPEYKEAIARSMGVNEPAHDNEVEDDIPF